MGPGRQASDFLCERAGCEWLCDAVSTSAGGGSRDSQDCSVQSAVNQPGRWSVFLFFFFFIWIPISFHNVVASLPEAHKRTKTYIQLKYTNITLPHVHIYPHIHTHTAFDNTSTYRQSQINWCNTINCNLF